MAAEVLLCTKVLGLTVDHATRTLASKTQGDIRQTLAAVTAEIEEEHRQRDERHAAEQEVMAERQAMFEAAWEAERNGDPDWFAKLLASGGPPILSASLRTGPVHIGTMITISNAEKPGWRRTRLLDRQRWPR